MKKVILILAMMLPMVSIHAQIAVDKIDDFTGKRSIRTERVRIVDGRWYTLTLEFELSDGNTYLRANFWKNQAFQVEEGETKLFLKYDDGTVIETPCIESLSARHSGVGFRERHAEFYLQCTDEIIRKSASNRLVRFRFCLNTHDVIEYDVKSRRAKQFQEQAVSYLEAIGK